MDKEFIDQLLRCLQELEGLWLDFAEDCELKATEIRRELSIKNDQVFTKVNK